MDWAYTLEAFEKLGIAALLGALIGIEREHHGRSAGLRTQLLVALGSALAMIVSLHFAKVYGDRSGVAIQVDPARVAYGVMAGIGFLGAGAIIRYGSGVRGLTTAASLWCTASVGLASGFGMYPIALVATGIVLFALYVLSYLDRIIPTRHYKKIVVKLAADDSHDNVDRIRVLLRSRKIRVVNIGYVHNARTEADTITFHVSLLSRRHAESILTIIKDIPDLIRFEVS